MGDEEGFIEELKSYVSLRLGTLHFGLQNHVSTMLIILSCLLLIVLS